MKKPPPIESLTEQLNKMGIEIQSLHEINNHLFHLIGRYLHHITNTDDLYIYVPIDTKVRFTDSGKIENIISEDSLALANEFDAQVKKHISEGKLYGYNSKYDSSATFQVDDINGKLIVKRRRIY